MKLDYSREFRNNEISYAFARKFRSDVLSLFEKDSEASLLDLGCWNGFFTEIIANKVGTRKIQGIDINSEELEKAKERGAQTIHLDLNKALPLPSNSLDVVSCINVIEHLHNTDGAIEEIYRILKPSGYLVITTGSMAKAEVIWELLLGRQPTYSCVSNEIYSHIGRETEHKHYRLFTLPGLKSLLEFHKFKIEKTVGSYYFHPLFPFTRWLSLIDKRHATYITVKARKI